MTAEQLASQAQSLRDNEAFQAALSAIRSEALENLAVLPALETEGIRNNQATVRVVDELRGNIEAFIRSGLPRKAAGIA